MKEIKCNILMEQQNTKSFNENIANGHVHLDLVQCNGAVSEDSSSSPVFQKRRKWGIAASDMARRTLNPIRRIVDTMKIEPNPEYSFISLSIGDPTVFGNLPPSDKILEAVEESLHSGKHNGYAPAVGEVEARKAVAKYMSTEAAPLTEKDVVIASACSGAIDLCLGTLGNPGDNILIPRPGFSLYQTLGRSYGLEVKFYNLLPEKEWEADLEHMESLIDDNTKCIVVNNPSNPCGSVYSKEHLKAILNIAERYKLPILADEIYAYSVYSGETFYPMASLTETVPVLACGAISKRFLVPGWRVGWILIHDRNNLLTEVRQGLFDMATRILGANSVIQGALPKILSETPQSFFDDTMSYIENISNIAYTNLSMIRGLKPIRPRGAMYMMVGIDKSVLTCVRDDIDFTEGLMAHKSVFCLPGCCFQCPDYFRIVLTVPESLVVDACKRIHEYCTELIERSQKEAGN